MIVKFKDLSGWLKLAAIASFAYTAIFAFYFMVGLLSY